MFQEFKKFALRGNALDMAIGIIIGAGFSTVVKSLVDDILMPPLGLFLGRVDFSNLYVLFRVGDPAGPYQTLSEAQAAGAVTLNYGSFISAIISFMLVAWAVFMLVKFFNRLKSREQKNGTTDELAPDIKLLTEIRDRLKK